MNGFDWDADISDADRDAMIDSLAERVARHQMQVPAILLLDMHRPLAYLAGQSLLLGSGFLAPLFGPKNVQQYSRLLQSRENIELLITRIEQSNSEVTPAENFVEKQVEKQAAATDEAKGNPPGTR